VASPLSAAKDRRAASSNARIFGVELVNRTSFPRHLVGQNAPNESRESLTYSAASRTNRTTQAVAEAKVREFTALTLHP